MMITDNSYKEFHSKMFESLVYSNDNSMPYELNLAPCPSSYNVHQNAIQLIEVLFHTNIIIWCYKIWYTLDITPGIEVAMFFVVFLYSPATKSLLLFQIHSYPKTNVLWLVYLVDILLTKKSFVSFLSI